MKQSVAPTPKKSGGRVFGKTIQAVLNGEFLTREGFIKHFNLLAYIAFLLVLNIAWSYQFENTEREIIRTQKTLDELKSEYNTTMSLLETREQQSHVAQDIKETGLIKATSPFEVIEVAPTFFDE